MGYDNRFTGSITITPPLTRSQIYDPRIARLADVNLRVVEQKTESGDGEAFTVRPVADAIMPLDMTYSGGNLENDIQLIVDIFGEHEFAGFIEAQWDADFGETAPERYVVRDGRVETLTPQLVWPGEDDPADRFGITWDHDFAYLWCDDCPNDEHPVDAFSGNPTGIAEIQSAMRKHRAETHKES